MQLELTKEELKLYVQGLDSSIRLICNNISSSPSANLMLKQTIENLIQINTQLEKLDKITQELGYK